MQCRKSTYLNILEPDDRRRASGFPLKANRFQSDRVEARIVQACRHAYPATEAISVAIAEKRKFSGPECEQALVGYK
jgi:hypothetical protein